MGLLDMLGQALGGGYGGMIESELQGQGVDVQGLQRQAAMGSLGNLGAALLAGSGTGNSFASILGNALPYARQGYQDTYGQELNQLYQLRTMQQMQAKQQRQQQLQAALQNPEVLAQLDPAIQSVFPFLDPDQQVSLISEQMKERARLAAKAQAGGGAPKIQKFRVGGQEVSAQFDEASGQWVPAKTPLGDAVGPAFAPPSVDNPEPPNPLEVARFEDTLRQRYTEEAKPARQAVDIYEKIRVGLEANNGLGDIAAIYGFIKGLDPTSVVREGEIALLGQARSVMEQMQTTAQRAASGGAFTPEARARMLKLSQDLVGIAQKSWKPRRGYYESTIRSYKERGLPVEIDTTLGPDVMWPDFAPSPQGTIGTRLLQQFQSANPHGSR